MRALTTDIKDLVRKLGPVAARALEGAMRAAVGAGHAEVTPDHLVRALIDLPDCDFCAALEKAGVPRVDLAARLDWHLGRLETGKRAKPVIAYNLHLLLQDAGALTAERVRTGHLAAALRADPKLSAADIGTILSPLSREPLHLLASRLEDHGEVGRAPVAAPPAPPKAEPAPAQAKPAPVVEAPKPVAIAAKPAEPAPASPAPAAPTRGPANLGAIKAHFGARMTGADAGGISLSARVGGRDTTLRLAWDADARVLVLRVMIPADPPKDEVSAAVALSTLNNALPHGAFVLEGGRLAFRSHVFLDAAGNAPIETLAFAVGVCEQAAEALAE
jgi:hypothetical protein